MNRILLLSLFLVLFLLVGCADTGDEEITTLEQLQRDGSITVGFANEVPFAYETVDGLLTGQAVEVAREVFRGLGINEVEGVLVEFGSLIPGLQAGRYDAITAGMYINPDRAKEVAFGNPEYKITLDIIVKAGNPHGLYSYDDIANNPDVKVAVMGGSVVHNYFMEYGVAEDQFVMVPDNPAAIAAIQAGRADVTSMTTMAVGESIKAANDPNLENVGDDAFEQPVIDGRATIDYGAAAFRIEDADLVEAYNRELEKLRESGRLLEIMEPFGFTADNHPGTVTLEEVLDMF